MHRKIKFLGLSTLLTIGVLVGSEMVFSASGEVLSTTIIESGVSNFTTIDDQDNFGQGVVDIGDIDGDGVNDIAVGARNDDSDVNGTGAVYVILLNDDASVKSYSKIDKYTPNFYTDFDLNDQFGVGVAAIGDFNNDGVNDIVATSPADDGDDDSSTNSGAFYIINLTTSGGVDSYHRISIADDVGDTGGWVGNIGITSLGDLAGDGTTAFAIGAYQDNSSMGAVHIVFVNDSGAVTGSAIIDDSTTNFAGALSGVGGATQDLFGVDVENVGDLDGNGRNELAVGTYYHETDGGDTNTGGVFIFNLTAAGGVSSYVVLDKDDAVLSGLANNSYFGSGISRLGDITGDGNIELAIGAEGADSNMGAVYVVSISTSTYEPVAAVTLSSGVGGLDTLTGSTIGFGSAVSRLEDLDGDGKTDLLVGAYRGDTGAGTNNGQVYVLSLDGVVQSGGGGDDGGSTGGSTSTVTPSISLSLAYGANCTGTGSTQIYTQGTNLDRIAVADNRRFIDAEVFAYTPIVTYPGTPDTLYMIGMSRTGNRTYIYEVNMSNVEPCETEVEPEGIAPGSIIKIEGDLYPDVYYVTEDGQRRVFPNEEIFYSWGFRFADLQIVTTEEMNALPIGDPMLPRGSQLIRFNGDVTLYYIDDWQKVYKLNLTESLSYMFPGFVIMDLPSYLRHSLDIEATITSYNRVLAEDWRRR